MGYTLYPHTGVRLLRNPGATRSRKTSIIATKHFTGTQTERIGRKTYRVTDGVDTGMANNGNNKRLLAPQSEPEEKNFLYVLYSPTVSKQNILNFYD